MPISALPQLSQWADTCFITNQYYWDRLARVIAIWCAMMRVLLIDDDADVLNLTGLYLQRIGHAVAPFRDPQEAVRTLRSSEPDLIISDIKMPAIDGFGVAAHVAETLGTSPPRLLLISGTPDAGRVQDFPPSMIIGVLPKPFSYTDLTRVLALLEPARSQCPGTLAGFCQFADASNRKGTSEGSPSNACTCVSLRYAECQYYDRHCGLALRHWVSKPGVSDAASL